MFRVPPQIVFAAMRANTAAYDEYIPLLKDDLVVGLYHLMEAVVLSVAERQFDLIEEGELPSPEELKRMIYAEHNARVSKRLGVTMSPTQGMKGEKPAPIKAAPKASKPAALGMTLADLMGDD